MRAWAFIGAALAMALAHMACAASLPEGYAVHRTLYLTKAVHGFDGVLEELEDARITPDLREAMWGNSSDLDFLVGADDQRVRALGPAPLRPSRLRLTDSNGQSVLENTFQHPLADIEMAPACCNGRAMILVTVDYSVGFGSYAGPMTMLMDFPNGVSQYVSLAGEDGPLHLAKSLKNGWRFVERGKGVLDIQMVKSHPDDEKKGAPAFVTEYSTLRYDSGRWRIKTRSEPGIWENDGPAAWPAASKFP